MERITWIRSIRCWVLQLPRSSHHLPLCVLYCIVSLPSLFRARVRCSAVHPVNGSLYHITSDPESTFHCPPVAFRSFRNQFDSTVHLQLQMSPLVEVSVSYPMLCNMYLRSISSFCLCRNHNASTYRLSSRRCAIALFSTVFWLFNEKLCAFPLLYKCHYLIVKYYFLIINY